MAYLAGYDAIAVFPEVLGARDVIEGFSFGYPLKQWAFELNTDYIPKTPLAKIPKDFVWDKIRLPVVYNLPVITK